MNIDKLIEEWKLDNEMAQVASVFEKQTGEALDIVNIQNLSLRCDSLNKVEITFEKNLQKYILQLNKVCNLSIEENKMPQIENLLCIRNGIEKLNFVIMNAGVTIAFYFTSGSLQLNNVIKKLTFDAK